ncbi:MAG: hypothetical protein NTY77_15340 [Elusimicrobia bacterium]|nr:hypothetical protein [Elusimicrobiota bacterium]
MSRHPLHRLLDALQYEYRYVGMEEKDGRPYKKFIKVPRLRSRHKQALLLAALAAVLLVCGVWLVRRITDRLEAPPEAAPLVQPQ